MRPGRLALLALLVAFSILLGILAYVLFVPPSPSAIAGYELRPQYSGLSWPVALAFAPDGRIFLAERLTGNIRIIKDGAVLSTPFYSLPDVDASGERGLLGLALSPGFAQDASVYAYYTYHDATNATFENRIVRIQGTGDVGTTMDVVFEGIPSQTIHNGGVIAFGSDGKLWAVVGDGSNAPSAQDLSAVTGKVLRMNSDGSAPADNPFVSTPGANPYVYTYGHRNMFGLAFHPATHTAYITENGPSDNDEINRLVPGGNYGWPDVRGIAQTSPYLDPILAYPQVIVPTNAAFATASFYAPFRDDLLFGDYGGHHLHALRLEAPAYDRVLNDTIVATAPAGILDVEVSTDGYVWLTTSSAMYRLEPIAASSKAAFRATPGAPFPPVETLVWASVFPAVDAVVPNPERRAGPGFPRSGVQHAARGHFPAAAEGPRGEGPEG